MFYGRPLLFRFFSSSVLRFFVFFGFLNQPLNDPFKHPRRDQAHHLVHLLAVAEKEEGGNTTDAEEYSQHRFLIDITFSDS